MLYLLTGDIQLGKTRWLEARLEELARAGVAVHGVLSPGVWVPREPDDEDPRSFEKTGIDLVFYPVKERVRFAERLLPDDFAESDEDGYDEPDDIDSAEEAGIDTLTHASLAGEEALPRFQKVAGQILGWKFYSYWFGRVNELFTALRANRMESAVDPSRRLVVIDEIGRLEIAGRGFTEAMAFLQDSENAAWPQVVAIVRSELLEKAWALLEPVWGEDLRVIHADDAGKAELLSLFE